MSVLRRLTLSLLPLFALAGFSAGSSAATDIDKEAFISKFEKLGMPVIDVVPSSIDGLPINAEKIAQFRDSMIEYKADNEKYAVTVFTDITCGYCVRLHQEMKEYNKRGITVRYLAFPRQGPSGQVADNMAKIWCAADPANVNKRSLTIIN